MPFFNVIVLPAKAKVVEKEEDDIAALIWQENQREAGAAAAVSKKKVDAVGAICSQLLLTMLHWQ